MCEVEGEDEGPEVNTNRDRNCGASKLVCLLMVGVIIFLRQVTSK